jgi:CUG-BP- and ETR3-like factor
LFIGMLALTAGEEEVSEMFGQFGEIKEVHMIRNQDGATKCAAFLRFQQRESAMRAIESMNNNFVMDGATRPLIVKFADNRQQRFARQQEQRQSQMIHAMPPAVGYQGYGVRSI